MAGRKDKNTVDYFPHYCNGGKTLFILENNLRIMFISVGFLIIKIYNSIDKLVVSLDFIDFVELKTISNMISKILKKGGLKNG